MNLGSVIGQQEIISSIKLSIKNKKVSHAYIFNGPMGIGKKMLAKIFAGLLLCEETTGGKNCGDCSPCRMYCNNSNPDFYSIEKGKGNIGIDEIRELQNTVTIKPMYSNRKVYLIADADNMTVQAQNCILKTIEEPPPYVTIILTTVNNEKLLETIKSRTIIYKFKKNTVEEVKNYLKIKYGDSLTGLDFISTYANGNIGEAIKLAESTEFIEIREKIIKAIFNIKNSDYEAIFDIYTIFEENRNNIDIIFNVMILLYRDLIIVKTQGMEKLLINSDKKDIIIENAKMYSLYKLTKNIHEVENAYKIINQNVNFQLAIEVMLMKLQEA